MPSVATRVTRSTETSTGNVSGNSSGIAADCSVVIEVVGGDTVIGAYVQVRWCC